MTLMLLDGSPSPTPITRNRGVSGIPASAIAIHAHPMKPHSTFLVSNMACSVWPRRHPATVIPRGMVATQRCSARPCSLDTLIQRSRPRIPAPTRQGSHHVVHPLAMAVLVRPAAAGRGGCATGQLCARPGAHARAVRGQPCRLFECAGHRVRQHRHAGASIPTTGRRRSVSRVDPDAALRPRRRRLEPAPSAHATCSTSQAHPVATSSPTRIEPKDPTHASSAGR